MIQDKPPKVLTFSVLMSNCAFVMLVRWLEGLLINVTRFNCLHIVPSTGQPFYNSSDG